MSLVRPKADSHNKAALVAEIPQISLAGLTTVRGEKE